MQTAFSEENYLFTCGTFTVGFLLGWRTRIPFQSWCKDIRVSLHRRRNDPLWLLPARRYPYRLATLIGPAVTSKFCVSDILLPSERNSMEGVLAGKDWWQ
ncbi:hypothetical protein ADEAN_000714700 [Angomonas deanei]|uniref:Uncharacterized protein n=1 Tax=Angomonas deanei TaxID=59799 RepID=A0A7G2CIG1_9TRYP|nr:hypothetical protein ADEAN_000714700 [Angomonas deanei]